MLTQVLRLGQGLLQRTAAVLETGIAAAAADIAALDADAVADGIIAAVRGEGVVALGIHRLAGRTGRPVGTEVESSLRAIGGLGYLEGSFLVVAGPALLGLAALQQGIALELLLDIGHQDRKSTRLNPS